jgi:hypothetical protein
MRLRSNSTLGMMNFVACAAFGLAFFLATASERSNPFLGLVIVLACALGVAWIRAREAFTQVRAAGNPMTIRRISATVFASCGTAFLIVGLADLAFLLAYGFLAGGPHFFLFSADPRYEDIELDGLVAGTAAGLAVCYLSRQAFRRSPPSWGRRLRRLAPWMVVLLLLGAEVTREAEWQRTSYRLAQADWHDNQVAIHGGPSRLPLAPLPPGAGLRQKRPALAAYHLRMRQKWERAAAHPWLSVEPDPPPPGS